MDYGENIEQGQFWNDKPGQAWVRYDAAMDERLSMASELLLAAIRPDQYQSILDVGCGTGAISQMLADEFGPKTQICGFDISQTMLDRAREKFASYKNIRFVQGDAQVDNFENRRFDLVVSRFGTMFFEDPIKAFKNIRHVMVPGGRLVLMCWAQYIENEFFSLPRDILHKYGDTSPTPEAGTPGPFAFSNKDYLKNILETSGFQRCEITAHDTQLRTADTLEENTKLLMKIGFGARLIRELELSDKDVAEIQDQYQKDAGERQVDGIISYDAKVFIVTAQVGNHML